MSIMAKTPSGYKKIGSAYLGERPVDKVFNANGDVVYALQRELTGVPPLLFKGKEQSELLNYRIYGDTVDGESVGDRTANLIQGSIKNANIGNTGKINTSNEYFLVYAPVVTGESYTISNNNGTNVYAFYNVVPSTETATPYDNNRQIFSTSTITFVSPITGYIAVRLANTAQDIMINPGSTALPYEPYGYKVPVTVEGKNLLDMKTFAELCYPRYASVTFADNTLSFTPITVDAYVNDICREGDTVPDEYRPSCINVLPSTTYTISMSSAPKCYISWISSSFKGVSAYTRIPANQSSYTFTTPKDCTKLLFRLGKQVTNIEDTFTISNIMLNAGSTPLPYEPYHTPVTTPIYLPEPIKMVGDAAEYIDYAEQKQHRVRKNLVQTIATSQTINDITFTVNANGSVTCNGTNHGNNPIIFELNNPDVVFPEGVYITSGCPAGGSITGGYKIQYFNGSSWNYELGSGSTFTLSGNLKYRSRILISKDVTVTNLTFYPMIRKADIEDDTYEPYIENTELDVTLPALPTIKGTNTMSVDTAVQPSRMDIKGRIKTTT